MVEKIREIVEDQLGIKTFKDYAEYKKQRLEDELTQEEIEQLSPDNIRSDQFWEWTTKSEFEKDAIAFGKTKDLPIEECNLSNHNLALVTGCLNYFYMFAQISKIYQKEIPILEIGPGYGFFKNMCEDFPNIKYVGVDVHPRIEGVLKIADGDTLFPDEVANQKFDLVFSSNVFQHLSPRQRQNYYKQISGVLAPYGIFSFNTTTKSNKGFKAGDKRYMCHYGQYVEIQSISEYQDELSEYFTLVSVSQRIDNVDTFHCTNKEDSVVNLVK